MKKDTNWGVAILIVMCVYFLLNFFYAEVRFNRLQSEMRDRVDGRVSQGQEKWLKPRRKTGIAPAILRTMPSGQVAKTDTARGITESIT